MWHTAGQVRGKSYLWGGLTQDFLQGGKDTLRSTVNVFDHYLENWQEQRISGVPPCGLLDGAYTAHRVLLYSFAGHNGSEYMNSLHVLDTELLVWRDVPHSDTSPMPKSGCGMVSFGSHYLATIGGYGIPTQPLQHGSTFIKDAANFTDGRGWTDEFHVFDITEGK